MSQYHESPVDRAIREAQERGAFDDLPGTGKPLNLGDSSDPDWWVRGLIQREQLDMTAALPPGVALRREIERLPQTLADVPTEAAAREIVEDLNRRVLEDRRRLTTGPTVLAPTVDVDEVIERWRAERERRYGRPGGTTSEAADSVVPDVETRAFWRRPWVRLFRRDRAAGPSD
jgi:hypothetical protein